MTLLRRTYRDQFGVACAEVDDAFLALQSMLESDVQSNVCHCDMLLRFVREAREGRPPETGVTGNCTTVYIGSDRVRIENEFAIPHEECELSLDEFEAVVRDWRAFIAVTSRT